MDLRQQISQTITNGVTDLSPSSDAVFDALGNKITYENVANFSNISVSTSKRLILVDQDETNGNEPTLYLHDGINLQWIVSQII